MTARQIRITRDHATAPFTATLEVLDQGEWVAIDSWDGPTAEEAAGVLVRECLAARGCLDVVVTVSNDNERSTA